jgi:hypothetical protein
MIGKKADVASVGSTKMQTGTRPDAHGAFAIAWFWAEWRGLKEFR